MDVEYQYTIFKIQSREDLSQMVEELGREVFRRQVSFVHRKENQFNTVRFELEGLPHRPDESVERLCMVIKNFTPEVRKIWNNCVSRTFEIGYVGGKSGESGNRYSSELRPDTIGYVAELRASIVICVYPPMDIC